MSDPHEQLQDQRQGQRQRAFGPGRTNASVPTWLAFGEDDFGVEEGAGYAGGDGDEVALSVEDFDLAGAGEFGEIDGASVADAGGGGFVGGDGGELGQELARVDEEGGYGFVVGNSRFLTGLGARFGMTRVCLHGACARFGMTRFCLAFLYVLVNLFEGVGLGDIEFGDGGAAERFEMGSAAELLAHIVGDGTHVGAGGDAGAEGGAIGLKCEDRKFLYLDLNRFQDYFLLLSGQLVGRDAVDFLGGEWGRDLLDQALEFCG